MSAQSEAVEVFRQEAAELLEVLEQTLLDLDAQPGERALVDTAFRALHTIKGSGAMFGFDAVAGFVHEFETAFDRVRGGFSPCTRPLVAAALAARDHIRSLIEQPEAADAAVGEAILAALHLAVAEHATAVAPAADAPPAAPFSRPVLVRFRLGAEALVNGTNPLAMLAELREFGTAEVVALVDAVPPLDSMDPEACYLGWEVRMETAAPRAAIEEVFIFVSDDATIEIIEEAPTGPAPVVAEQPVAVAPPPGRGPGGTPRTGRDRQARRQPAGAGRTARRAHGPGGRAGDRPGPAQPDLGCRRRSGAHLGGRGNRPPGGRAA